MCIRDSLRAVGRRDHDACTQRRLGHRHRQIHLHVGSLAGIIRMWVDLRGDEQVACLAAVLAKTALALEAQASAIHGAGRDLDGERVRFGLAWDAHGHTLLGAVERLVERHVQRHVHVLAFARTRLAGTASEASQVAEVPVRAKCAFAVADAFQNVGPAVEASRAAEDVFDVHRAARAAPSVGYLVFVRRAVLVVQLALLVVAQNFVGLVKLLEFRLVAARIGVMLRCV